MRKKKFFMFCQYYNIVFQALCFEVLLVILQHDLLKEKKETRKISPQTVLAEGLLDVWMFDCYVSSGISHTGVLKIFPMQGNLIKEIHVRAHTYHFTSHWHRTLPHIFYSLAYISE